MKAILIEDEPLVAKNLVKLLAEVDSTITVEIIIPSVEEAVIYFQKNPQADVVFMDIQLSDGVSFDIFEKTQINLPIIFTTAYNEYAIRAFKVNSVDYLLKPVDKNELLRAIEKLKALHQAKSNPSIMPEQLSELIQQLSAPSKPPIYKHRFMARHAGAQLVLPENEISHFKKETLIYIVTNDKKE
ncbi:MAG: response regulator [Flavobacteriales bacterium]|nr:response regulator [Flavobacteriales bacterium]